MKKTNTPVVPQYRLINKQEAEKLTGLSAHTLRAYRLMKDSPLIDGVHYEKINARVVRYRSPLIEHWADNRHKPEECLRMIEQYLNSLG